MYKHINFEPKILDKESFSLCEFKHLFDNKNPYKTIILFFFKINIKDGKVSWYI